MAIIFADNYATYPNETGLGSNYAQFTGESAFSIVNGFATPSTHSNDCGALVTAVSAPANCHLNLVLATVGTNLAANHGLGFLFRANNTANSFYRLEVTDANGSVVELNNAGSFSQISSNATNWANGDLMDLYCIGSNFYVWRNSALLFSFADTTLPNGSVGLGYSSTASVPGTISSFYIDDMIAPTTQIQLLLKKRRRQGGLAMGLNLKEWF